MTDRILSYMLWVGYCIALSATATLLHIYFVSYEWQGDVKTVAWFSVTGNDTICCDLHIWFSFQIGVIHNGKHWVIVRTPNTSATEQRQTNNRQFWEQGSILTKDQNILQRSKAQADRRKLHYQRVDMPIEQASHIMTISVEQIFSEFETGNRKENDSLLGPFQL